MFCSSLIKPGEIGRSFSLENRQHCPKTERLAKDTGTIKCCRCNEVMLQARGDLEKLIRNAWKEKVRPRQDGLSKPGKSSASQSLANDGPWGPLLPLGCSGRSARGLVSGWGPERGEPVPAPQPGPRTPGLCIFTMGLSGKASCCLE